MTLYRYNLNGYLVKQFILYKDKLSIECKQDNSRYTADLYRYKINGIIDFTGYVKRIDAQKERMRQIRTKISNLQSEYETLDKKIKQSKLTWKV